MYVSPRLEILHFPDKDGPLTPHNPYLAHHPKGLLFALLCTLEI
jgi:hypothetical protein